MNSIEELIQFLEESGKTRARGRVACDIAEKLYDRGQFEDAVRKCKESIRLYPLFAPAYMQLGDCYWMLGNPEAADVQYEKCLHHEPSDNNRAYVLHRRGLLAAQGEHHHTAAAYFEEATLYEPTWSGLWYRLAYHGTAETGELKTEPLRQAFRLDVELLLGIEDDPRWHPWRAQIKDLLRQEH